MENQGDVCEEACLEERGTNLSLDLLGNSLQGADRELSSQLLGNELRNCGRRRARLAMEIT